MVLLLERILNYVVKIHTYRFAVNSKKKEIKLFIMSYISINGKNYSIKSSLTIFSLLLYLGFKLNLVVIDYNGTILPREFWSLTLLEKNDQIEILTIAGGG